MDTLVCLGLLRLTPAFQLVKYFTFLYTALTEIELSYATSSILQASDDKRFYVVGKMISLNAADGLFLSSFVTPDIENAIRNQVTANWDRIKSQHIFFPFFFFLLPFDC